MSLLRRQLPVRSPLSLAAALAPLGTDDARPLLREHLSIEYPDRDAVLTASGTAALQLALEIVKVTRGTRPVAMPAYGCFDLATAALGAGVRVRLYDLDSQTLQPDMASLRRAIGTDAAAVVVVHLYGLPVPLTEIRALTAAADAVLIEDAAQGSGALIEGQAVGGQGELGILSFGRGKGVTGGGGGALLVSAALREAAARCIQAIGPARDVRVGPFVKGVAQWLLARPAVYGLPSRVPFLRLGETVYHPPRPVAAMPPALARTLRRTWPLREAETRQRQSNAGVLRDALSTIAPALVMPVTAGVTAGWLRLPLLLPAGITPSRAEAAGLGIVPAYPISLDRLGPFATALSLDGTVFHGAQTLAARLWTLPTHGALGPADLTAVIDWMRRVLLNRPSSGASSTRSRPDARA